MSTNIVMNNGEKLANVLGEHLKDARTFLVATAYLNQGGLAHVQASIRRILDDGGNVSVVHGFNPLVTETEAIQRLAELKMDCTNMNYGVFVGRRRSQEGIFHPKMYLTESSDNSWRTVIGSSNLTSAGLSRNLEVNCTFHGSSSDPVIRECKQTFDRVLNMGELLQPTAEWLEAYDEIRQNALDIQRRSHQETNEAFEKLFDVFQVPTWLPKTRDDCVVKALQYLESINGAGTFHHLDQITPEAWNLSSGRYKNLNWAAGVRQVLNTNTIYRSGSSKKLFERRDGDKGNSGLYRLSERGRRYSKD